MIRPSLLLLLAAACSTGAETPFEASGSLDELDVLPVDQAGPVAPASIQPSAQVLLKGGVIQVTVGGVTPNRTVALLATANLNGQPACPAQIAPECLDIAGPFIVIGTRRSAANGTATFSVAVPSNAAINFANLQGVAIDGPVIFKTPVLPMPAVVPTADEDNDGLSNLDELSFNTNVFQPDTDGDGLNDLGDVQFADPLNPDTDGDGLTDGDEVLGFGSDPTRPDSDFDGLLDFDEAQFGTSLTNPDSDGDTLTDGDELFFWGSNPLNIDTDGDGLGDLDESQRGTALNDADSDDDFLSDFDEAVLGSNPLSPDTDNDDLSDLNEVNLGTGLTDADSDDDGLIDGFEYFSFGSNPLVPDTDSDDLLDADELAYGTSPTTPDTDADGLSDGEEVILYGTSPTNPDSDGGSVSDGVEVGRGSNPLDASDDVTQIGPRLLIVEVVDHLSFPNARFVEIFNSGDQPALLDGWSIGRYSNAGTTATNIALTAGASVQPGESWVVAASNSTANGFPFAFPGYLPALTQFNANVNGNGDDVYELRFNGNRVDIYGVVGVQPAAGTTWNYLDSVAKRQAFVQAPNATFDLAEWVIIPGDALAAPFDRN